MDDEKSDEAKGTCLIWQTIINEYNKQREELESYLNKRDGTKEKATLQEHPVIIFLNNSVFPTLCEALVLMLEKVRDEKSCYRPKSTFNGLDFISEYLYNMNVRCPERRQNWKYIFDMDWVQEHLKNRPRPYFPLSLVWSREHAAIKIQSFMRGYWQRRRDDVQEIRRFWKDYKISKITEGP